MLGFGPLRKLSGITNSSIFGMFDKKYTGATSTTLVDDRSAEQMTTFIHAVVARDTVLSGFGDAKGGMSYCAWACRTADEAELAMEWVERRSDMTDVEVVDLDNYEPPKDAAHFHIYVCGPDHPALQ
jgi:hypothetical protein